MKKRPQQSLRMKGKNNPAWKGGIRPCVDCGKKNSRQRARCRVCYQKFNHGENHHSWNREKKRVCNCGKSLSTIANKTGKCQKCYSASLIKDQNMRWRGGRRKQPSGYILAWIGPGKSRLEHRVVMEKIIGRKLESHEIVHHLNGIRDDNRPENLAIVTRQNHENRTLPRIQAERIRALESEIEFLKNEEGYTKVA